MPRFLAASALLAFGAPLFAQAAPHPTVTGDPPADAHHPADMAAFVLPSHGSGMNALLYTASGVGPHPTLLLLHGFPGNEQNLDLAQAARRAGWNVLTLHYRGSWGSRGSFSFGHAATDAAVALQYLRTPEVVARYRIDAARIAVAGHSMGGFMAADAAAGDPAVVGLFLIDAWDIGAEAKGLANPTGRVSWDAGMAENLPPLAGTSAAALANEIVADPARLSLPRRIVAYGDRPIAIIGAARGNGADNRAFLATARTVAGQRATGATWPTDHSFSDHRVALASALIKWLDALPGKR